MDVQECSDDIQKKHDDIQKLMREIEELKELQQQFAHFVNEQSTQINHIEDMVVSSNSIIKKGNQDIQQAVILNNSYNTKRNILLLTATGVLLLTTPMIPITAKIGLPILNAVWMYPKISIPIAAILTLKFV